jgi:hypothetical protein
VPDHDDGTRTDGAVVDAGDFGQAHGGDQDYPRELGERWVDVPLELGESGPDLPGLDSADAIPARDIA